MFTMKKSYFVAVAAAASLFGSWGASAQSISQNGPIVIEGVVSVDNTAPGGLFTDFKCAVTMTGWASGANDTFEIRNVQAFNTSNGNASTRGCNVVEATASTANPWIATVSAGPGRTVTIAGVSFTAVGTGQPGCGYDGSGNPDPNSVLVADWVQDENNTGTSPLDSSFSRVVMNSDNIVDARGDYCLISGELRVYAPKGPNRSP